MTKQHTPGPWIDSPGSGDAIISLDDDTIQEWLSHADPNGITASALKHYGGAVICENVQYKDLSLIKSAPKMLGVLKFWLGAVQESLALRLALTGLPNNAGVALVQMLDEAIVEAEGQEAGE